MHKTASITCHGGKNTQHDIYVTEDARMRQVHVFIYMFYNLLDQRHTTVQVVVWWIPFTPDFLSLQDSGSLSSAALGKEHSAKNSSAKNSLPSATCRALGKAFAECHVSTRQS